MSGISGLPFYTKERRKRNDFFTVRLTVRRGGESATLGLKNAFLMPLTPLLYRYLTVCDRAAAAVFKEELEILAVG